MRHGWHCGARTHYLQSRRSLPDLLRDDDSCREHAPTTYPPLDDVHNMPVTHQATSIRVLGQRHETNMLRRLTRRATTLQDHSNRPLLTQSRVLFTLSPQLRGAQLKFGRMRYWIERVARLSATDRKSVSA